MQNQQLIARDIGGGLWQWANRGADGQWLDNELNTGDSEALAASLASQPAQVSLVLRGQQVVATEVEIDAKQRKHAAKLIPYELEDALSAPVDELHFSFEATDADKMAVLYTADDHCRQGLNELSEQGADVRLALPDYLLLNLPENGITLVLDGDVLCVRLSKHWGFSIEADLAAIVLARLAEHSALADAPPHIIRLYAADEDKLDSLKASLPDAWQVIDVDALIGDFWDAIEQDSAAAGLNLRKGKFARQLPYKRWLTLWRKPTMVMAAAFVLALLVNLVAYFSAKGDAQALREQINAVYLDAVPNGRLGDVERMLESKLATGKTVSTEPSNFMYLLSKVSAVLDAESTTKLSSMSYSGSQRSLQLTIDFPSLEKLSEFRTTLSEQGIESDSPRTSSIGERYQARIKVREAQ